MRRIFYLLVVIIICVTTILFVSSEKNHHTTSSSNDGSNNDKRVRYITSFGWRVSPDPVEKTLTLIPQVFSKALTEYNDMQLKSGFDLRGFRGKEITRFSYRLLNHPLDKNYARVNLFVYKGEIVAADVSSTKLDGFMHSIRKNNFD